MLSAEQLHERGVEAINSGRFRTARTLLTRAQHRADDDNLMARIEASLAYVTADLGDADAALELCTVALGRSGLTPETRGVVASQRALLLMRRGETAAALQDFAAAIGSLGTSPADLGKAHLNRGGVFLQQGDPSAASRDFGAAARWLSEAGLEVEAAKAEHNLGYADLLRGDLIAALAAFDRARPVLAPLSPVTRAICEQDRAEVLMSAGLVQEGQEALRAAARAYGVRRLHQRRGEAELVLARSFLVTDPEQALVEARHARGRFGRAGSVAWRVRAQGVVLAAEVELGRRGPSLVRRADDLAAELDEQGLGSSAAITRLHASRVLLRRGELEEAGRRLAGVPASEDEPLSVRILRHTTLAELAEAEGSGAVALERMRRGLDDLHDWQSSFGSLDVQTSVVGRGRELAISGLRLAVADGRPDVVFEWSERARMLATRVRRLRPPQDADVARDLTELRRMQVENDDVAADPATISELRRRVRLGAMKMAGSGEVSDPATLAEVQASLGADQALVAYVAAAGRVVALAVTDTEAAVRDLGSREALQALLGGLHVDLDMAGSDLPDAFAAPVRRQLVSRLDQLDALLVAPVADLVGDRRLVLTPSGVLAGVPWGLLPGMHGRPVTVTRSATSWLSRQATPLRLSSGGFVAGPRVPRASAEVKAAAETWPAAEVLVGEASTAAAVSDLAARVDVLHVSAHGRHSAENPLFSGVELVDGPWFGYDIDQLAEIPDVVLLSACEVGRSEVRFGEELVGMTTAWLHAGVRCVIASAAAVNDVVAHDVLVAVHRALGAGEDPARALAAACPPATEDAPPAPFVCFC